MINRVFICGYLNFPHGSAPANYVQNLAKAIKMEDIAVSIVSNIDYSESDPCLSQLENIGIVVNEVKLSHVKFFHWLQFHLGLNHIFYKALKKQKVNENDVIITYSSEKSINKAVLKYSKRYGVRNAVCVAEWYDKKDLSMMPRDRRSNFEQTFDCLFKKYDLLFSISQLISAQFEGNNVMYLPMMTDPQEMPCYRNGEEDKIKILFVKKSIEPFVNGLYAISRLPKETYQKLEFHFCGFSNDMIEKTILHFNPNMEEHIVIHNRMKYSELVELYDSMHFLLLLREDSQTSRANLPSKVVETMSRGVIPMVSDVGEYVSDYLNETNSIVFSGCSTEACYDAIVRVANMSFEDIHELSDNAKATCDGKIAYYNWAKDIVSNINDIRRA